MTELSPSATGTRGVGRKSKAWAKTRKLHLRRGGGGKVGARRQEAEIVK
jgi:hypothetical protein